MLCRFSDLPVNYKLNFVKWLLSNLFSFNHFCELLPIKCFVSNIVFFN